MRADDVAGRDDPAPPPEPQPDPGAAAPAPGGNEVARFVEQFALLLTDAGWPRTPARLFACLLADDSGRLTAREMASRLNLSPAAVSGGVRFLIQIGLVARAREPGDRRDHYRLAGDPWHQSFVQQTAQLHRWEEGLAEGIDLVGPDSPAGRRLAESRDFFRFLQEELPMMLQRWREVRGASPP